MKYILLSFLLLQSFIISASDRWQHVFGGSGDDEITKVIHANGSGWITTGFTNSYGDSGYNVLVVRWNEEGEMIWEKVIGNNYDQYAYSAALDASGNIYIAGKTNDASSAGGFDILLLKLDSSGTEIWQHTYGGTGEDYANAVIIDSLGDVVMAGGTKSFGVSGSDSYLVKVNSSGTLIWSKTFGSTVEEYANCLAPVTGGGYILAGRTTSVPGNLGYVVRTNNSGDTLWTKSYNIGTVSQCEILDLKQLTDTEFIYAGYGGQPIYGNLFDMKTNLNGNLSYIHYSNHLADGGYAIEKTSDGGYAIAGSYANFGNYAALTKFSSSGVMQWEHVYRCNINNTYNFYTSGVSLVENSDGSYIVAGNAGFNNYSDGFMLKTDSAGFTSPTLTERITANPGTNFCDSASVNTTLSAPPGYMTYQWYKSPGGLITGATSQSYVATTAGKYYCLLVSEDDVYYSNLANITVTTITNPPVVTPSGIVNRCTFTNVNDSRLSVPSVAGQNYQWLLNGIAIPGATNYYYNAATDGLYSVTALNNCGSQTSAQTEMHINQGPQNVSITTSGSTNICFRSGQSTTLIPSETSYYYTYTWLLNNSPIPGLTNSSGFEPSVSGNYSVIIRNACGVDTSNTITILTDINAVPVITSSGHSNLTVFGITGTNYYCGTDTLYCAPNTYPALYEWKLNGSVIPSATSSYCLAKQAGSYTVTITDSCGTSAPSLPFIVSAVPGNDSLVVSNTNSCGFAHLTAPIIPNSNSYTWYQNNVVISFSINYQIYTAQAGNFYSTFQPAICPSPIPTNTVTLNASLGSPVITPTPSASVCSGNILLTVNSTGATYAWKRNGTVISGATSQSYSASQTGTYRCIVSRPGCTPDSAESTIMIATNRIVADRQVICPSGHTNIHIQANEPSASFQWRLDGINLPGDTNYFINADQPGTYDLRIIDACGNYITNSVTLDTLSTVISPSGTVRICPGDSLTLSAAAGAGYQYRWYRSSTQVSGSTSTLTIPPDPYYYVAGVYYAQIIIPSACVIQTEDVIVQLDNVPSNNIYSSTSPEICGNGNIQLNARTLPGLTYQWYKDSVVIPSATSSTYNATANGDYYVTISDSVGCANSSNIIVVNENHLDGELSGNQILCAGTATQLTLNSSATTYQWYFYGNSIAGATSSNYLADSTGIYSVSFSDNSGCAGSLLTTITILPLAPAVISTSGLNFCVGDTAILRVPNATNRQWYRNGVAMTGETNYQLLATQSGSYTEIEIQNGCVVYSDTVTLNFSSTPFASITSSQTSLCSTPNILLTANQGINQTYQWKKNGTVLPGETFVTYNAISSGIYTCEVTSNCGTTLSNPITITSPFNTTISASGVTTFCSGNSVSLNATPSSGGYSYQWKNNNTDIPGATSATYSAIVSGNYSVEVSDVNGCFNSSTVITVDVISQTPSPDLTSSSAYFCPGGNTTLSVDSANLLTYQWMRNGTNIPGATHSVYVASAAGMYTCSVTNTCGGGISDSVFIFTSSFPVVNLIPDTTLCTGSTILLNPGYGIGYSYLWQDSSMTVYLNLTSAVPVTNHVNVTVTNLYGCASSDSTTVTFAICTGINTISKDEAFLLYPNPATEKLNVYASNENNFTLNLIDLTGRNIFSQKVAGNQTEVNISSLATGVYFIQIQTKAGSYLRKFVKE